MKVTCPSCGERQDDAGLTSFTCRSCGKTLRTSPLAEASTDESADAPFGWSGRGWIAVGVATHLVGAVWLIVALDHHSDGEWAPSFAPIVGGAIVTWLGFLLLLLGLTAYAVELVRAQRSE